MFYRYIFISHSFCFVFTVYQCIVQILSDILLSALDFRTFLNGFFYSVNDEVLIKPHLFHQFRDQAIILCQQRIEQMLLCNLLVAIVHCNTFTVLNSLQ